MAELIYSVRNIFEKENADGCLTQHNAENYLIPTYQRGYKWASDEHGAVTILLNDLKKAFETKKNEYYLQYITVKETKYEQNKTVLELIDGQQRLTTLSIFISVISSILRKEGYNSDDYANGLLNYEVRGDFFQESIHEKVRYYLEFDKNELKTIDSQDKYYIISAAQKIYEFVTNKIDENEQGKFFDFVSDNVKIIVNVIDRGDSERVFSNLNSNKVNLTEAELIKGILLTKVSRGEDKRKRFREITEERMKLGLQWDEMARWCNKQSIRNFYFMNTGDGITALMNFSAHYLDSSFSSKNIDSSDYPLFNFYLNRQNYQQSYEAIVDSYRILKDLYENTEIYNMMGYLIFTSGSDFKSCADFITKKIENNIPLREYMEGKINKTKFKIILLNKIKNMMPENTDDLWFPEDYQTINRVLLALNVFQAEKEKGLLSGHRFDFYSYYDNKWSLEHIFPRAPEGREKKLSGERKEEVEKLIENCLDSELKYNALELLKLEDRDEKQKDIVHKALGQIVNTIGNICLLTRPDNSSNGNKFFDEKRENILCRIKNGSFVPKHTFEVFSKTIFPCNPGTLTLWTKDNIDAHKKIIAKRIQEIRNFNYKIIEL